MADKLEYISPIYMTPDVFENKMKEIARGSYTEEKHRKADRLLCETLESLGYIKGVEIFRAMDKWYS